MLSEPWGSRAEELLTRAFGCLADAHEASALPDSASDADTQALEGWMLELRRANW